MMNCRHTKKVLMTEADGCYWVQCPCGARGPKKHSRRLALLLARTGMKMR